MVVKSNVMNHKTQYTMHIAEIINLAPVHRGFEVQGSAGIFLNHLKSTFFWIAKTIRKIHLTQDGRIGFVAIWKVAQNGSKSGCKMKSIITTSYLKYNGDTVRSPNLSRAHLEERLLHAGKLNI